MNDINKKKEWEKIVKFYEKLIQIYNWNQKPMLNLVRDLKTKGFWEKYYPSTSHEALGISRKYKYDERCENPMIYIQYQSDKDEFLIHYQKCQGNQIRKENCGNEISNSEFKKINNWLIEK